MTDFPLCLPLDHWPESDRMRWIDAKAPAGFLEDDKPASGWSPARLRIVEQAYGQWLSFLARNGFLNGSRPPGERVTDDLLRQFIEELRARVAPASASMMVGALLRMLVALEPQQDWRVMGTVYNHLKQSATPTRNKLGRMVPAADLFALGLHLMDTCGEAQGRKEYASTQFRDGLLIAVLIACPVRLKNLAMIAIRQHLLFDGLCYRLEFSGEETKTGRPYVAEVPPHLTAYMDRYIGYHRRVMQLIAENSDTPSRMSGPLWIDRHGEPMSSKAIRHQIKLRTEHAFGRPIWPHLFRDISVTELVDIAPQEFGIAPDLLGHTSLVTTQKHYILSQGMQAHWAFQDALVRARRQARERANQDRVGSG